jgi:hypothetical protein
MRQGTMIIFASDYLHSVNPYHGTRRGISMSWNVTLQPLPERGGRGRQADGKRHATCD